MDVYAGYIVSRVVVRVARETQEAERIFFNGFS